MILNANLIQGLNYRMINIHVCVDQLIIDDTNAVPYNTVPYKTVPYNTVPYNTGQ